VVSFVGFQLQAVGPKIRSPRAQRKIEEERIT